MVSARTGEQIESLGDLLAELGGVSPDRVRLRPAPGTATVEDVVRLLHKHKRKFELVDGTLVEKPMGFKESALAMRLGKFIDRWNDDTGERGVLTGPDGPLKLMKKLVRIPDLAFTFYTRLPGGVLPTAPVPDLAPDLAVEVLSESNKTGEMERKLKEYFLSEVQQVWFIDPKKRTVIVYTSPDDATTLTEKDTLTGGDLLPGFALPVCVLFEKLAPDEDAPAPTPEGKKKPRKRK
jgi:Uma2 family endonuclease